MSRLTKILLYGLSALAMGVGAGCAYDGFKLWKDVTEIDIQDQVEAQHKKEIARQAIAIYESGKEKK